jgi:hypothetical protein
VRGFQRDEDLQHHHRVREGEFEEHGIPPLVVVCATGKSVSDFSVSQTKKVPRENDDRFDTSSCRRCARLVLPQGGRNATFDVPPSLVWASVDLFDTF